MPATKLIKERVPPNGERQAQYSPQAGEKKSFSKDLADNPPAAGTESQPGGELFLARNGSGKKQVRQVGASDEENEHHHAHQDFQGFRVLNSQVGITRSEPGNNSKYMC